MITLGNDGLSKLAEDAGVLLFAPFLFLCFGLANARLSKDASFRERLVLALAVLFAVFAICAVIIQDRTILIIVWQKDPVVYSLVYSIASILCILGLGVLVHSKLRPKLWRRSH